MEVARAKVAWHSLRGRRETNQDAALVHEFEDGRLLVAVADGMGGHEGGAEASLRAVEALLEALRSGDGLGDSVEAANAAVREEAASVPSRKGMGTTLVALLSGPDEYSIANVGDSRAYRIEEGRISQLTVDHSFALEALGRGMSREEIEASPWRNALTRAIGTDPEVVVDVYGPFPTKGRHQVCLCTDGLYRALSDERIRDVILSSPDPDGAPKHLAELAYSHGSSDNITVALISVGSGSGASADVDLAAGQSVAASEVRSTNGAPAPRESADQAPPTSDGESDVGRTSDAGALSYPAHPLEWATSGGPGGSGGTRSGGRHPWRRGRLRLSSKARMELWGAAITILLSAAAAFVVLSLL